MDERKSRSVWPWVVVVLMLPVLYVASSGPLLPLACRVVMSASAVPTGTATIPPVMAEIQVADWWMFIYRPLLWMPEDSRGERFFFDYWSLFAVPGIAHAGADPPPWMQP